MLWWSVLAIRLWLLVPHQGFATKPMESAPSFSMSAVGTRWKHCEGLIEIVFGSNVHITCLVH